MYDLMCVHICGSCVRLLLICLRQHIMLPRLILYLWWSPCLYHRNSAFISIHHYSHIFVSSVAGWRATRSHWVLWESMGRENRKPGGRKTSNVPFELSFPFKHPNSAGVCRFLRFASHIYEKRLTFSLLQTEEITWYPRQLKKKHVVRKHQTVGFIHHLMPEEKGET